MNKPNQLHGLENLRILDFSWVLAGPFATRILADFGAEIIKVQPVFSKMDSDFDHYYYNMWNRNKLGITLNLSNSKGLSIAKKLVAISDVVVENFSPRVMSNWGMDYDSLRQLKPDIIMLSLSTMGHYGPWRNYVGFGPTVHAFSGLTSLIGYPGESPIGLGTSYADHAAGLFSCLALIGALEYRRKTGKGQFIDISQVEVMCGLMGSIILEHQLKEDHVEISDHATVTVSGVYRCRGNDRWCVISITSDKEWRRLVHVMAETSVTNREQFMNVNARWENNGELNSLIETWTIQHTAEEIMTILQCEGIAAGVVQNAQDIAMDPQLESRDFFVRLNHPTLDETISDGNPIYLSQTPHQYIRSSPVVGQHNEFVYRQLLGMSDADLQELKRNKVI